MHKNGEEAIKINSTFESSKLMLHRAQTKNTNSIAKKCNQVQLVTKKYRAEKSKKCIPHG